jgi:hypothetical protein
MTIPWVTYKANRWTSKFSQMARTLRKLVIRHECTSVEYVEILDRWWIQRPWYVRVQEWLWRNT